MEDLDADPDADPDLEDRVDRSVSPALLGRARLEELRPFTPRAGAIPRSRDPARRSRERFGGDLDPVVAPVVNIRPRVGI